MHLKDIKYIWVVEDEYGDIQTEFFYPEIEENKIPYQLEKYLWSMDLCKAVRLKIEAAFATRPATCAPTGRKARWFAFRA